MARSMMLVLALFVCAISLVSSESAQEEKERENIQARIESLLRDVAQAERMLANLPYPNIFDAEDLAYFELIGQQLKYGTISLEEGRKEFERLHHSIFKTRNLVFGGYVSTFVQAKKDLPILIKKHIETARKAQRKLIQLCSDAKHHSTEGNLVERDLIKLDLLALEVEMFQYDFFVEKPSVLEEIAKKFILPLRDIENRLYQELARIELLPSKCPSRLF